jgi:RHS repeat-associated protein
MGKGAWTGLALAAVVTFSPISQARFLTPDPKLPAAGNIFGFNRYAYANNNPIVNIDPTGMYACGSKDKATCTKINGFVNTLHTAMGHLDPHSSAYAHLDAVSKHIGTLGDGNGVTLTAGSLGKDVVAQANSSTTMTVDVKQAAAISAIFQQYNPSMSPGKLANAFGAEAIAHEGQHQLDYMNPKIGYPTNRATEHTTEMNAYRTEIGVARGLGVSNDLYAPGATAESINARINDAANTSTEYFCQSNGC